MVYYEDTKYGFFEIFNEKDGTLVRSNIFGTNLEATMRSFPELIDIGIMGSCEAAKNGFCSAAGVDCYQNAINSNRKNMSLEEYQYILEQSRDKVFQVALGGAGDPNKHENFKEILSMSREYNIVPNLTTSGYNLTDDEIDSIRKFCGAVAVSYYSRLLDDGQESNTITVEAIKRFVDAGCVTNIHCVVSDENIEEITYRLEKELWPTGIRAIIFILYKPVGLGVDEKKVKMDQRLLKFMNAAVKKKHFYRVGFDTCFTSALIKYCDVISVSSIDACEAARFSMYIDSEMNAYPCSFDNQGAKYKVSLRNNTISAVWNGDVFERFRTVKKEKCDDCKFRENCGGGCKLQMDIDLC